MTPRTLIGVRIVALLALACTILGCHSGDSSEKGPPPPQVSVCRPLIREVVNYDDYEGRVKAIDTVDIRTKARGYLLKVNFKDGAIVEAGKLLFEVDPKPYELSLEAALAMEKGADGNMAFAKSEYNRVRTLAAKRAASVEEAEVWRAKEIQAHAEKLKALATVDQAKHDLEYCKVKAPFTGRLSRTQVNKGALINAGGGDTLLTTIVSVGPMYVYFNVDEYSLMRYRREFRKGKTKNGKEPTVAELKIPLYVGLEGEEGYPHTGVVDYADNKVDPSTGTLEARGWLANKKDLLQDGMRARVRIPVSDPYKAMLITERAIASEQGRKFVYVVKKDNVVERRDVTLDRLFNGLQVVGSGLNADDQVVVNGIQRVREGLEVKPTEVSMPDDKKAAAPRPVAPGK